MHPVEFEKQGRTEDGLAAVQRRPVFPVLQEQLHRGSRDPPRGETVTRTWPLFWPTARPVLAVALAIVYCVDNSVGRLSSKIVVMGEGKVGKRFCLGWRATTVWTNQRAAWAIFFHSVRGRVGSRAKGKRDAIVHEAARGEKWVSSLRPIEQTNQR